LARPQQEGQEAEVISTGLPTFASIPRRDPAEDFASPAAAAVCLGALTRPRSEPDASQPVPRIATGQAQRAAAYSGPAIET